MCLTNYNKLAKSPLVPELISGAARARRKAVSNVFLTDTPEIISKHTF